MKIEFDVEKSAINEKERGLPFIMAAEFDFETAFESLDTRHDYGETRIIAYGYIGTRLHMLCFKPIKGGIRVISLRKANKREEKKYDKEKEIQAIDW